MLAEVRRSTIALVEELPESDVDGGSPQQRTL
jgi:hypothetical protein